MPTLKQLSVQYGLQAETLHARLRAVRTEATRAEDPMDAYFLRRRADMLREMWRDTRDMANFLAHYYDGAPSRRATADQRSEGERAR